MARLIIALPNTLMGCSVLAVTWLLYTQFPLSLDKENFTLAAPLLWRTLVFALITAAAQLVVGLAAALCVLWLGRSRRILMALITLFVLPYAVPATVIGLIFRFALGPQSAWAEVASPLFGVPVQYWLYLHLFTAAMVASIWQFFPFTFLLTFLALKTTPPEMLRAAQLDGAPFARITRDIVLHRIAPVLFAIFLLRFVFMMVKFDTPYVFTEQIDSPEDVATIELWRVATGSTAPELSILAWGLQLLALILAFLYHARARRSLLP